MHASYFGGRMVVAGLACIVHAVLPFVFVRTGSQAIEELNAQMLARKRAAALGANVAATDELTSTRRLPT